MHKWSVRLLVVLASVGLAACGERLDSGAACPLLCSGQSLRLKDTILDAVVVVDTTLTGFPPRNLSAFKSIANSGDSVESRYVIRFDTLISKFKGVADSIPITEIDSAFVRISIDPEQSLVTSAVTFEAYDVDAESEDSATAAIAQLFRPERLLGFVTVDSGALQDTLRIPLNNGVVLSKAANGQRLRIGIRLRAPRPASVAVRSRNTTSVPFVGFDPAPADTAVKSVSILPSSRTPSTDPNIAADFTDFVVPVGGQALPSDVIGVGGPRGRRIYLRFLLPAAITDSTTVVRATLILNQRPAPTYGFADSIVVASNVVIATKEVTDLGRAALLIDTLPPPNPPSVFGLPSIRISPGATAERRFEIASVVRFWRSTTAERVPQAIVLRSADESTSILEAQFYSSEAAPALRPRLLITYLPRNEFGIP